MTNDVQKMTNNKTMKTILSLLAFAGITLSMTGCLKDDANFVDFKNTPNPVVQFPTTANKGLEDPQGFFIKTAPVSYTFNVGVSSSSPISQAITVTLAIDDALLKQYNADNGTTYRLPPASLYTIPTLTATIPAGQQFAMVGVNLTTSKDKVPDAGGFNDIGYVLPLSIKTVSGANAIVGGNYASKLILLKIKNDYDGDYRSTGVFTHPTAGARNINRPKTLSTIDGNTVQTEFADLGGSAWFMRLRINADNTVTITPRVPAGQTGEGLRQTGTNRYNPNTQTFTLNYRYAGAGGDRVITETIVRQ
jgi:Domain of unknown function (DUF1735)/Domain of unknown function (DUF4361)